MKTDKDIDKPINQGELCIALALEIGALTESQASEMTGWGADVVGFRGRLAYIHAEVSKFSRPRELPNLKVERPRWDGWPITGD
jgi:hypothetical protein